MHFLNSEIEFLDHENMGIDTLVELLVYIVMPTKTGFSVMVALIKGFWVQSHTQDPAATRFYDEGGRLHQKMRFTIVALFTYINLLGSWSNYNYMYIICFTRNSSGTGTVNPQSITRI